MPSLVQPENLSVPFTYSYFGVPVYPDAHDKVDVLDIPQLHEYVWVLSSHVVTIARFTLPVYPVGIVTVPPVGHTLVLHIVLQVLLAGYVLLQKGAVQQTIVAANAFDAIAHINTVINTFFILSPVFLK